MSDRDRVLAYLTGLVAIFVLAWALGSLWSPDVSEPDRHQPDHSQEMR